MRQLESLIVITTIVPCKPGMGAAEDTGDYQLMKKSMLEVVKFNTFYAYHVPT